jgi:hypothetical protein
MKGVEEEEGMKEELLFVPADDATLISSTSRRPKPVTDNIVIMIRIKSQETGSVKANITIMVRSKSKVPRRV